MSNDFDNKNLPQISPNRNIARASKQLATVNKALTTISREKFIEFLAKNEDAAKFFITHISRYSNVLDMDLIDQHADQWDWKWLSMNDSLPCSESLIEHYEDKWNWDELSTNIYLPWSESLIERFADRWSWGRLDRSYFLDEWEMGEPGLSSNQSLPWSETLIERYADKWDWLGLSHNESLPWSESLIERYQDKWNWNGWVNYAIKDEYGCYTGDWTWVGVLGLSCNESLPWSEAFIERYADKWKWGGCVAEHSGVSKEELMDFHEESLPFPLEFNNIEDYKDKWDWGEPGLSINESLPWSEALIERFTDKWIWGGNCGLSSNKSLPWSEELLEHYEDKWGWKELSRNESLPWSESLIEHYEDKWNWDELSNNNSLPWSESLIERYKDKWGWKELSRNESLPWSESLIEHYEDKWNWDELSNNNSLPWSEAFIERYADGLNWRRLNNNEGVIKVFSSWTKQEISTALERIRSAHYKTQEEYESFGGDQQAQLIFDEEKSLSDFVEKTNHTEHIFADIINDLNDAIEVSVNDWPPLTLMAYGYTHRTAAAALYIKGLMTKDGYVEAKDVFKGLQIKTEGTVAFQEQAASESVKFMAEYNKALTRSTIQGIVMIAEGCEIPPGTFVSDDELLRRVKEVGDKCK
jgi:hypothetical protein